MLIDLYILLSLECLLGTMIIFWFTPQVIILVDKVYLSILVLGAVICWFLSFGTRSYIIRYGSTDNKKEIQIGN